MSINLPNVDINAIDSLNVAKQVLREVLNSFEIVLKKLDKLEQENVFLKQEIARFKDQPKKPQFSTTNKQSQAVSSFLKNFPDRKKNWHKSAKKGTIPIDQDIILSETEICACGSTHFSTIKTTRKIVQGMIIRRNNTAYHGKRKKCISCGKIYNSSIPSEVRDRSFDQNIQSLASLLKFACRLTHPLLYRFFRGFGIQISYGQITAFLKSNSKKLHPAYIHLKKIGVRKSLYLQSDATGAKRKEKQTGKIRNQYVQVVSNKLLSIFSITRRYNAKTLNSLLGKEGREKPFVSDDGSPNGECLKCKDKQLCWVHEIRHYKKLFPFFNSHQYLQENILGKLRGFYHLAKVYGQSPPGQQQQKREEIEKLFDEITSQITGYDLLDKQLKLTKKKKERLLTFLDFPYLPIHNNQCEQDVREFVIQRKISGETKSVSGDRSIERHLSIIQTAQKQGLDIFKTLHGLLTGDLTPAILTSNIG